MTAGAFRHPTGQALLKEADGFVARAVAGRDHSDLAALQRLRGFLQAGRGRLAQVRLMPPMTAKCTVGRPLSSQTWSSVLTTPA